jgi:hypothetical protein
MLVEDVVKKEMQELRNGGMDGHPLTEENILYCNEQYDQIQKDLNAFFL